jgi:hypothetical protein
LPAYPRIAPLPWMPCLTIRTSRVSPFVSYRMRRMWTDWTMPNIAKYVIRLEPP